MLVNSREGGSLLKPSTINPEVPAFAGTHLTA
jgi:hypothetical protein